MEHNNLRPHLVIEVVGGLYFKITHQAWIHRNFFKGQEYFQASNGFVLASRAHPEILNGVTSYNFIGRDSDLQVFSKSLLFVRGNYDSRDYAILEAPSKRYLTRCLRAVCEYNTGVKPTVELTNQILNENP